MRAHARNPKSQPPNPNWHADKYRGPAHPIQHSRWDSGFGVWGLLPVIVLAILASGCGDSHHGNDVAHKIATESDTPAPQLASPIDLTEIDSVPIRSETGVLQFYALDHTVELPSYPCSSCHMDGGIKITDEDLVRRSHWGIKIDHAEEKGMTCATCHHPKQPADLKSLSGEVIPLNRPDKLCASCHSEQHVDWEGGAHGKRYKSWSGERVAYSCASCHDPHAPAFPSRWPVTYPEIPRGED